LKKFILLVVFLSCSASSLAEVKTLNAFETELDQAFPVLLAEDQLEISKFAKDKVNAKNGWKLFGNLSTGYVRSVQAVDRNYNYFTAIGKVGILHPLLGSAEKELQLLIDAGKDVAVNELNMEWVKKKIRMQLAEDYAIYWTAQQKETVGKEYSELAETVSRLLQHREGKGVLLKADRMEAMTAFERARYEGIQNQDVMHGALDAMTAYLGHDIQPFIAVQPLPAALVKDNFQLDLNQHHELKVIAALIEAQTTIINNNKWRGVESDFIVTKSVNLNADTQNLDSSISSPDVGYGAIAGVNVQVPFSVFSYRKADKNYASATLKRLNTEYQAKQRQLQAQTDALFRRYDRLNELIGYQEKRLAAVSEMVRERALRMQKLDEDVIEKYLQALYEYYRVTMDYIDAQAEKWQIQIKLAEFIEIQNEPNTLVDNNTLIEPLKKASLALKGKKAEANDGHIHMQGLNGLSIYLWDSVGPLGSSSQSFWQRMSEQGIDRILLSLNQKQINQYQSQPDQLNNFLKNAKSQSIKVDLLLGEPSWMLSENRGQLLTIIRSLNQFDFNALHLDLEINQLEKSFSQEGAFNYWLDTVKAAATESRWPVAISSHPRYLQKNLAGFDCFVCKLYEAGVGEISVMIYVTNTVNVLKTMTPLMKEYPNIKFSVAQSVEKQLSSENSYASYAQDTFLNYMMKLQTTLKAHGNYSGLVIQSWRDLEEYLYENTVR
jgi:outer membrane protein TolC